MTQPPIAEIHAQIDWRALRIILEVARSQSLKSAAANLGMTESTVSRYVSSVEGRLGLDLFERTPKGMMLTSSGENLFQRLQQAEFEVEAGLETALGTQAMPAGTVRLTTVPLIANRLLTRHVHKLLNENPKLELELVGLPADLSMMSREADLAIRLSRPVTEMDVLTRKIGSIEYGVYAASPELFPGNDASALPWLSYEADMSQLPNAAWISNYSEMSGEAVSNISFNDAEGLVGAVIAGLGKTLLPKIVAATISEVTELNGYRDLPERELWLLTHPNLVKTRRVQVVTAWLKQVFSEV